MKIEPEKPKQKRTVGGILARFTVFFPLVFLLLFLAAGFFYNLNLRDYETYLTITDEKHVSEALNRIHGVYGFTNRIPILRYAADRLLFQNAFFYEAYYDYHIVGNYDKVIRMLENRNEIWAYLLLGSSWWQKARYLYRVPRTKQEAVNIGYNVSHTYFEKVLDAKTGKSSEYELERDAFNYDLTANLSIIKTALEFPAKSGPDKKPKGKKSGPDTKKKG